MRTQLEPFAGVALVYANTVLCPLPGAYVNRM